MMLTLDLILASQSPRRKALLSQLNLSFTVRPSPAEEVIPDGSPADEVVRALARQKAAPVAQAHPEALVLAADTVVACNGAILTKPTDAADARQMLRRLSGTHHRVLTGVALHHAVSDRQVTAVEATHVAFAELTEDEIRAYVATGSPMDKAGGYGIQDHTAPLFIDGIEGDYYTVVGLPLRRLYRMLRTHFPDAVRL